MIDQGLRVDNNPNQMKSQAVCARCKISEWVHDDERVRASRGACSKFIPR